jgi:hypothetical protein
MFKKLPKVKKLPIGENSPNLVTLLAIQPKTRQRETLTSSATSSSSSSSSQPVEQVKFRISTSQSSLSPGTGFMIF